MLKRIIPFILCLILCFSMSISAFADNTDVGIMTLEEDNIELTDTSSHSRLVAKWDYLDVSYGLRLRSYNTYRDIPLYVAWDGEMCFIADYYDVNSSSTMGLVIYNYTDNKIQETLNFSRITADDGTYYWLLRVPVNSVYYGLPFSSLLDFRNKLDSSSASVYYIEDVGNDFSDAVNLYSVDLGGSSSGSSGGSSSGGGFTASEKASLFTLLNDIKGKFDELGRNISSYFSTLGNRLSLGFIEQDGNGVETGRTFWTVIDGIKKSIDDGVKKITDKLDDLIESFKEKKDGIVTGRNIWDALADIANSISTAVTDIAEDITGLGTTIVNGVVEGLKTAINGAKDVLNTAIGAVETAINSMKDVLNTAIGAVETAIETVGETIQTISTNLTNFFTTFFTELFKTINNLINHLFVPPSGYFDGKMDEFRQQVPFVGVISDFNGQLFSYFERQGYAEAPTITANLSLAEGKYNYGFGNVTVLDLSWYGRFKPYVDMFLSAILWITYLWLLYKRLPDIIYGAGAVTESVAEFKGVNVEQKQGQYRRELRRGHRS